MSTLVDDSTITQVHASPWRFVLALTGGGSRAIAQLLEVPGASRTLIEAVVPYHARALDAWIGGKPDHYSSEATARAMAMAAFEKALLLEKNDPEHLAGVAATCSLRSDRPKRGPHRVHVALQTAAKTRCESLELSKGTRTREDEEQLAAALVLRIIFQACGLDVPGQLPRGVDDSIEVRQCDAPPPWTELLLGRRAMVWAEPAGELPSAKIVFPGSFHPWHEGHRRMVEVAESRLGGPVALELSIRNVDKPTMDFLEVASRLHPLAGRHACLTRAATFAEKAELFPGATFVVGGDTLERIADPRYYGGRPDAMRHAIETLRAHGCRFLVFGRRVGAAFRQLGDIRLPDALRDICDEVSERQFRIDISSTELRR